MELILSQYSCSALRFCSSLHISVAHFQPDDLYSRSSVNTLIRIRTDFSAFAKYWSNNNFTNFVYLESWLTNVVRNIYSTCA